MLYRPLIALSIVISSLVIVVSAPAADQALKPYLLGYRGTGAIETKISEVKAGLEQKGFQIVGEYEPYKGTHVLAVTSDTLKTAAAASDFGAYGAIVRVSVTDTGKEIQVAATNPRYYAAAYRLKEGLDNVAADLEQPSARPLSSGQKMALQLPSSGSTIIWS